MLEIQEWLRTPLTVPEAEAHFALADREWLEFLGSPPGWVSRFNNRSILEEQEPNRKLFLAITDESADIFYEPVGQLLISKHMIQALVFDPAKEEILRWIP